MDEKGLEKKREIQRRHLEKNNGDDEEGFTQPSALPSWDETGWLQAERMLTASPVDKGHGISSF